jgi:hypothetical protein
LATCAAGVEISLVTGRKDGPLIPQLSEKQRLIMSVIKNTEQKPEIGQQVIAKLLLGNTVKYSVGLRESEM